MGLAVEEQSLADDGLDRIRGKGLRDQERRLGRLPSEKEFGITGHENYRDFMRSKDIVDGVEPGASVRKLNVGEDEARTRRSMAARAAS